MNNYINHLNSYLSLFFTFPNLTRLQTIKDGSSALLTLHKITSIKTYEELKARERVNPWILSVYGIIKAIEEGDWDIFTRGIGLLIELGALEPEESFDDSDSFSSDYTEFIGNFIFEINLQQLSENGIDRVNYLKYDICAAAALNNRFNMLKYASKKGFPCEEDVLSGAAKSNNMEIIKWLINHNTPCNKLSLVNALKVGNTEMFKLLIDYGCVPGKRVLNEIIEQENIEALNLIIDHGFSFYENTFASAVKKGRLDIAKILFENNCPWDKYTPFYAVMKARLDILKWLRDSGCPWAWKDFPAFIARSIFLHSEKETHPPEYKLLEMMKWLYDNGELHDDERLISRYNIYRYCYGYFTERLIEFGYWDTLQWLFAETSLEKRYIISSIPNINHLPTLKVIFESGDVGRDCVLREQAGKRKLGNLKWLYENVEGVWDDYFLVLYGEYYREDYGYDEMLDWVEERTGLGMKL